MKHFIHFFVFSILPLLVAADSSSPLSNTSDSVSVRQPKNESPILQEVLSTKDTDSERNTTEIGDIMDIRAAEDLPTNLWRIALAIGALLMVIAYVFYYLRKHWAKTKALPIVPIDPYQKAMQNLEKAFQLIQRLDQRPFASGLTDGVRQYLADVFDLPAPEYTTEEVLEALPKITTLTEDVQHNIIALLRHCDLAKFTQQKFSQEERLQLYQQAKDFIQAADKLVQLTKVNQNPKQ